MTTAQLRIRVALAAIAIKLVGLIFMFQRGFF